MASRTHCESINSESEDQTDDARMQQYKAEVTRKLLENFNLEDTLDSYRDMSKAKLRIDPADFSFDSSLAATRMRNRLIELMGSDEVGMSDLAYVQKLRKKIWEEYEKQLDREETTRAEAEKARLRRLMMEGVITADDLRADPCMLQEYRQHMKKLDGDKRRGTFLREQPQKEKPRRRKRKRRHNEPQSCPYGNEKEEEMTDAEHELEDEEPRLESKNENSNDTASQRNVGLFSGSATVMKQLSGKQLPTEKTRRWPRHTSPLLEQLRREETLDGLYSVAEKIIIQKEMEDGTKIHM